MPVVNIRNNDGTLQEVLAIPVGGGSDTPLEPVDQISDFVQGVTVGEYYSDKVTSLRLGAFSNCVNLTKISLPNCTEILGRYAFNECTNVIEIELPNLQRIADGNYTFYNMENVEEISLPNLTTASAFGAVFGQCNKLKKIDLRNLGGVTLETNCFRYCSALEELILGGTAVNPLANTNVFGGTPATMSIYVPDNLVDDYKGATNWATYASRIKSRNDYPGGAI